jgi:hypothetical protein
LWLKAWNHGSNDVLLCKTLDVTDLGAITMLNQGNGNTVATSTTSTTNAVGVVLWLHG